MLEKHGIEVDTAESAELAIEYLGTHRPDAIFMDHMMGGMDGLQAVQAIKNNPRTATIPIMMYTSQEGELYVGQARALGAIGVLPKQVKPADVTKVLYQLNLAVERRGADPFPITAEDPHGFAHAPSHADPALREQLHDLRRTILAGFDSQGDRLLADLHTVLQEPQAQGAAARREAHPAWLPWALAAVLAGACVAFAVLYWEQGARLSLADGQLAQLKAAVPVTVQADPAPAAAPPPAPATPPAAPAAAGLRPIIQTVPFGVEPFSGARLDAMRQLFDRLIAQGFQGNVDIRSYNGRFCLVGNATEGYSLAPDDLPYVRCDVVAGAHDESGASVIRIPVVMADLMGTLRATSHDQIHVQVGSGDGSNLAAYPGISEALTAGEWNRAASANNRIEIRVR